ncbi:MAG: CzcE family metal-binding protein [Pseudomonadota bacterium]
MKTKSFISTVLALTLIIPAIYSMAAPNPKLLGEAAPGAAADRSIAITAGTKYINVQGGQVVKFDVDGKAFTWHFDGAESISAFDLNQVTPPGLLDHIVTVYVSPNPLYSGD